MRSRDSDWNYQSYSPPHLNGCRPLLRWAGSKKRQFPLFSLHFPRSFRSYVEPFAGSAAFLFQLGIKGSKLNDLNTDVTDFYRYASLRGKEFFDRFAAIPRERSTYYDARNAIKFLPRSFERSVLFFYLNRNCFNGIYRVNKSGHFNVPYSDRRVSPYPSLEQFLQATELIQSADIQNTDFETFCDNYVESGDFVFLDPPYYNDEGRVFNEYQVRPFDMADFSRLQNVLDRIDRKGAHFLLSFPETEITKSLSQVWETHRLLVRRTVAGNPVMRRNTCELLISNYAR
ncbi:DNA adenine methylase [Phyllobacterium sp. 1468]|uniref:DNA adenine methylase n=1 Tax=Phyllobacterium sp. 1468 TaxID=2817759 RepID=UPI0028663094|nr:DNA adenine methylase [Phyllobacterium sp. 1468]